jgi:hypothetical protein
MDPETLQSDIDISGALTKTSKICPIFLTTLEPQSYIFQMLTGERNHLAFCKRLHVKLGLTSFIL